MNILWIVLGVIVALLAILVMVLIWGKAKIRITVRESVKVVFSVGGIRFWLYPLKYDIAESREELLWIKKARAKRRKQKKLQKAQIAAGHPVPNALEKLQMVVSLLKTARGHVNGKLRIQVRKFHLQVAAGDAAQTAILYGAVVGVAASVLQWIDTQLAPIERRKNTMTVTPDYVTFRNEADVDIVMHMSLYRSLIVMFRMFSAYHDANEKAVLKATRRLAIKQAREKRREEARAQREQAQAS